MYEGFKCKWHIEIRTCANNHAVKPRRSNSDDYGALLGQRDLLSNYRWVSMVMLHPESVTDDNSPSVGTGARLVVCWNEKSAFRRCHLQDLKRIPAYKRAGIDAGGAVFGQYDTGGTPSEHS